MKCKILSLLFVSLLGMYSCGMWENQNAKDYYLWETYQIGNSSHQAMTLHFQKEGEPKVVYAEIYDQSSLIYVSKEHAEKECSQLLVDSVLSLEPGQTVLFYNPTTTSAREESKATCFIHCGYGDSFFNIFRGAVNLIGTDIIISMDSKQDSIVTMNNHELWETWYNETNYTYYHYWRIE